MSTPQIIIYNQSTHTYTYVYTRTAARVPVTECQVGFPDGPRLEQRAEAPRAGEGLSEEQSTGGVLVEAVDDGLYALLYEIGVVLVLLGGDRWG